MVERECLAAVCMRPQFVKTAWHVFTFSHLVARKDWAHVAGDRKHRVTADSAAVTFIFFNGCNKRRLLNPTLVWMKRCATAMS
jgi:hypothetical protein